MILDIILIILLLAVIGTFAGGWRSGTLPPASPAGIILVVLIIALLLGVIWPHFWYGPVAPPP
jgi:NhaP-type Na+/H+ or K+/H+ antiporter